MYQQFFFSYTAFGCMLTQPEQIFQTFSFLEMDEDNDALDSKIQTFH